MIAYTIALLICLCHIYSVHAYEQFDVSSQSGQAREAHERAMELATKLSREADAVEFFEKAAALDPENLLYVNDLGVVSMRTGNYQRSFDVMYDGLKKDPTHQGLSSNMKSLFDEMARVGQSELMQTFKETYQQSILANVKQRGIFSVDDVHCVGTECSDADDVDFDLDAYVESITKSDGDDVEEIAVTESGDAASSSEKKSKKGKKEKKSKKAKKEKKEKKNKKEKDVKAQKSSSSKSNYTFNVPAADVTFEFAAEWFGPWFRSATVKEEMRSAFARGIPYIINPFLAPDKAELLHQQLYHELAGRYPLNEGFYDAFQYHHHNIFSHEPLFASSKVVNQLHQIMDSPLMKSYMQDVSGITLDKSTVGGVSHYQPGDYSMGHSDRAATMRDSVRRIAFVLHMSRGWDSKYGGTLVYLNPMQLIESLFNNMILFKTTHKSFHIVTPIAHHAPPTMKRLAYSGWFSSFPDASYNTFN